MRFKISIMTVLTLGLAMATVMAADVTGTWVAESEDQDGQTNKQIFVFKADGANLTGTVTRRVEGQPFPILEGKIDGDNISFAIRIGFTGPMSQPSKDGAGTIYYKGKVAGDEIELTREIGGGMGEYLRSKRKPGDEEPPPIIAKRQK